LVKKNKEKSEYREQIIGKFFPKTESLVTNF
jgi:hypothetical protein